MKIETTGDEFAGLVILAILLAFLLGVVGPCVQEYGVGSNKGVGAIGAKP